jgi:protein arginine kinase activator
MLCDECGKNKATVHLTEIINEQITKLNLCEVCAKEKGSDVEQHFGIADLLAALSDVEAAPQTAPGVAAVRSKCSHCGLTYEDFKKIGRLGCADCYTEFKASLAPLLKRIHGAVQHLGKSPTPDLLKEQKVHSKIQEELRQIRDQFQKAVKNEEFEEAATLRDKIKFIEKKLKEGKA